MSKSYINICLSFLLVISTGCYLAAYNPLKNTFNGEQDPVRFLEKTFEEIDIQNDVVFGETVNSKGEQQKLLLDVYTPDNDPMIDRPVIVWIHGGGFRYGNDKSQSYIVELATRFAKKGYVCISIDYRVREKPMDDISGTISDAVEDAAKALAWVRENEKSLGIDASKMVVGGGSAGGILGSSLCLNDQPDKKDSKGVIGFINLWGTPSAKWMALHIDKNDPPTIMVHGTDDQLVAYSSAVDLAERLKANNIKHELVTIEGAGHTPVDHMDEFEINISKFLYAILN